MASPRISEVSPSEPPSPAESFMSHHSFHVETYADSAVGGAIQMAHHLLKTDPEGYFCYKRPQPHTTAPPPAQKQTTKAADSVSQASGTSCSSCESEHAEIAWCTIQYFSLNEILNQLREYISRWHLSPATKFVLITQQGESAKYYGRRYYIDAIFSKPTPACPNPLATARVHFTIHVSDLLPKDYPVMVTYKFEGYKTIYFALGEKALQSMSFQRYFIDSLLQMKLTFYSEIFQCRHSTKEATSEGDHPKGEAAPVEEDLFEQNDEAELLSRQGSRDDYFAK